MNKLITIRVPLAQFSYLEFDFEGTPEEAITEHNRVIKLYTGGEGMSQEELDAWVENMLLGHGNSVEVYTKATPAQQQELHRIKRALNRIKRRQGYDEGLDMGEGFSGDGQS